MSKLQVYVIIECICKLAYRSKFLCSKCFMIITKIVFTSQNTRLLDEEIGMLGINNSHNLVKLLLQNNLVSSQNGMNHENLRS